MGAWGTGPFENDAAGDWVYELEESKGVKLLKDTFAAAEEGVEEDYLENGSETIAAGETVAAMLGRAGSGLPEEVAAWVAKSKAPPAELVTTAKKAVALVLDHKASELRELWEDAEEEDRNAWRAGVQDLLQRLG